MAAGLKMKGYNDGTLEKKTSVHEGSPEKEETSTITEEDYQRICPCQRGSALNLFAWLVNRARNVNQTQRSRRDRPQGFHTCNQI